MTPENRTEAALQRLRERGVRMTRNRQLVIRVLAAANRALSAAAIYAEAAAWGQPVHRLTLYRTLDALELYWVAHRLPSTGDYLLCQLDGESGCHHYLLCRNCGETQEFRCSGMGPVELAVAAATGFRIERHYLEYTGLCPACQSQLQADTVPD